MIHEAAHRLTAEHGLAIEKRLSDQDGTVGYLLSRGDDVFLLVAKAYAYHNMASFMSRLVAASVRADAVMIFYSEADESFTVFDAKYYQQNAAPSSGKSKTRDTSWLELTRDVGCDLADYLDGRKQPRTLAGNNQSLSSFV
jgi:hypothetical protein